MAVVSAIRERDPSVSVVPFTGNGDEAVADRAHAAGAAYVRTRGGRSSIAAPLVINRSLLEWKRCAPLPLVISL